MNTWPDWTEKPSILLAGIARHGHARTEKYCHRSAWAFHIYQYHGELRWEKGSQDIHPDTWSLVPPDLEVEWSFPMEATHYFVHFTHPAQEVSHQVWGGPCGDRNSRMTEEIEWICQRQQSDPRAAEVCLWNLLHHVNSSGNGTIPTGHSALNIASSLLRNHLDRPMRIHDLARQCGVSSSHLNRLFQAEYGHSAQEHLQQTRLEVSTRLLRDSSLPIRSIAERVGLPDLHAFNKFIRKRTGASPSAYRRTSSRITGKT